MPEPKIVCRLRKEGAATTMQPDAIFFLLLQLLLSFGAYAEFTSSLVEDQSSLYISETPNAAHADPLDGGGLPTNNLAALDDFSLNPPFDNPPDKLGAGDLGLTSDDDSNLTAGVVYTRWGNSQCPVGAHLVYSGTAAGSYYSHSTHLGGGSNYLCLPPEPVYDEYETAARTDRALLYSSEYITSNTPARIAGKNYHTPSCAVCKAPSGNTNELMVPGRNVCPSNDWRLEYKGYLMAELYSSVRTQFVCMDREMEAEPGTQGSQGGARFYMVESRCLVGGGLPCGPYINGYELTCAVCTI